MDDLQDRYERLVKEFRAGNRGAALAAEANALAAASGSTWLRVQARALSAAARAADGGELDVEAVVDAILPPIEDAALARLDELLPGPGTLAGRLAAHDAATRLPPKAVRSVAEPLIRLLHGRAVEDLALPAEHRLELEFVELNGSSQLSLDSSSRPPHLRINANAAWTVERLVQAISSETYPGRYLASLMRPPSAEWSPSPQTTVDDGLAMVGREILLADHELAHELERIRRAVGMSWNGDRIVAVGRARDGLAPAYAAAAIASQNEDVRPRLAALGSDPATAEALVARWSDPLERATSIARAAGPPLIRAWLAMVGQTTGLQRLVSERLVPTMLREEMAHAG